MSISLRERKIWDLISSRGKVAYSLDASPLVGVFAGVHSLADGLYKVRAVAKGLVLSLEVTDFYLLFDL